jgi:L-rhamnose mutarotase
MHKRVWPELLAKLKDVGISGYSIFRRGQDLFLCMRVDDFDRAWDELDRDPVNRRWQEFMSRLFEPITEAEPGERFAMFHAVFEWHRPPGLCHRARYIDGQHRVCRRQNPSSRTSPCERGFVSTCGKCLVRDSI